MHDADRIATETLFARYCHRVDHASAVAYGLETEWQNGDRPARFTDQIVSLPLIDGAWRIERLVATMV